MHTQLVIKFSSCCLSSACHTQPFTACLLSPLTEITKLKLVQMLYR